MRKNVFMSIFKHHYVMYHRQIINVFIKQYNCKCFEHSFILHKIIIIVQVLFVLPRNVH